MASILDDLTPDPLALSSSPLQSPPPQPQMRSFGDTKAMQQLIFDNVLNAASKFEPVANQRYQLALSNVHYNGPERISKAEQKQAILAGRTPGRELRGTWTLNDVVTGQPLASRKTRLGVVPYLTDSGTFIHRGSAYTLAHQTRLLPGVFTRVRDNGELEAHVNVMPGKGIGHRIFMDPATGIFKAHIDQADIPLLAILKASGVSEREIREAWGDKLAAANMLKDDPRVINKLYTKLVRNADPSAPEAAKREAVAKAFAAMELDPEVTKRTLGQPFKHLDKDAMLATTKKLIAIMNKSQKPDNRDHPGFQRLVGPEDVFAEQLSRGRSDLRKLLWKISATGTLDKLPAGVFQRALDHSITGTNLGQSLEEINPAEIFDQQARVTRLGEGGISSLDSVPDESRAVQPGQFGFVDFLRTPESGSVGVDARVARGARKGADGRFYTSVIDPKTGEVVYKSPQDLMDAVVAFPNELRGNNPIVAAFKSGNVEMVPRESVNYVFPHMEDTFSPLGNMVPLKSMVKGQRAVMAARMLTQSLPLQNAEAPLVQNATPENPERSFEEEYGAQLGAVRATQAGTVESVSSDGIKVRYADGTTDEVELYNNHPFNRKTFWHQTPLVQPGQTVEPGQLLARSNYTDDKGTASLGLNARVAYIPFRGMNYEDAIVISSGMAKRLTSEHMYQHNLEKTPQHKISKQDFVSIFPGKYDKEVLSKFDANGIIKPGSTVNYGDPLVLGIRQREVTQNQLHKGHKPSFIDETITWEHHQPGTVTDVHDDKKGASVIVKAFAPMQVGDKLCYDSETEVLTKTGWKPVTQASLDDEVATLNPTTHIIEYLKPAALHTYAHEGRMYKLQTTQVDLLVTDNHNLYAKPCKSDTYELRTAASLYGTRYRLKRDGIWHGHTPEFVTLPAMTVKAGQSGNGSRELAPQQIPARTYAMLLGMFLSEGNLVRQDAYGAFGFDITQIKEPSRQRMLQALRDTGVAFTEHNRKEKIRIYGKQWLAHLTDCGTHSHNKRIPRFVFDWDRDTLQVLFDWLLWGDGHVSKTCTSYTTTSRQLADDVQQLCLHLGMSANVQKQPAHYGFIKGKKYRFRARYVVSVYRCKNAPEINHGHANTQGGQLEAWVQYSGNVYCVTLPRNHVLYVRRNGKPVWCGNSGRYGDKGVISEIVPDDEMPVGQDGKPYEVLLNPLGIISRTNPAQLLEAALGKIAAITGKPYKIKDFDNATDMIEYGINELQKHGLSDTEEIVDPLTQRRIPNIMTGNRWFMKLHHTAECFDAKTETLTQRGWVRWPDVTAEDKLATLRDGHLVFERPLQLMQHYYSGDMYCFTGRYIDYVVTPNHRLYIRGPQANSSLCFKTASDLHGKRFCVPQFGMPYSPDASNAVSHDAVISVTDGIEMLAGDYAELIGWWASEGYACATRRRAVVVIYQSRAANPEHFARIEWLVTRLGLPWSYYRVNGEDMGVHIFNRQLAVYLKQFGTHSHNKRLPRRLLCFGPDILRRCYDAMMAGDGNIQETPTGPRARYTSTSKGLADDFQELCIRMGIGAVVRQCAPRKETHFLPAWECGVALSRTYAQVDGDRNSNGFKTQTYTGIVYCAEMETGLLYVRRNGKPMLSGNSKNQGRGLGAYTAEGLPAKGGATGSKRIGILELNSLISHGATDVINDASLVRGQASPELWSQYMSGFKPATPKVPLVYEKFVAQLTGAGINVVRNNRQVHLMALTDKDIDKLAGDRELQNSETVDWRERLRPKKGGLFDESLTGGHNGKRWSFIRLPEPLPNPVMEEPIRHMLGLTKNNLSDIIAGKQELGGKTGPGAITQALQRIDVDKELERAREEINSGKRTLRDQAVRRLGYLKDAKRLGVHPKDWVISKAPVLPPAFRPVSVMGNKKLPLVSDPNYLYKELFDASQQLKGMQELVGDDVGDEHLAVYNALKGVVGLGDPVHPKNQERNVKGILKHVFGTSPKVGVVQRRLLGSAVDLVGRSVISPNPDLDMDQVAIPEDKAWEIYKPIIVRHLVRRGMPRLQAARAAQERLPAARAALTQEMSKRPVIINRAPTLHRYGMMASWPRLTKNNTMELSPLVVGGFGADFDGDAMNYHVPLTDEAVQEAIEKMLPSRNLFSAANFKVQYKPSQEYVGGLYEGSVKVDKQQPPLVFKTAAEAIRAYQSGAINSDRQVEILEKSK